MSPVSFFMLAASLQRLAVVRFQYPAQPRFRVKHLPSQKDKRQHAVVAVFLQGASAHFQPCRHLPVRQETFTAQCRTAVCHEVFDAVQQTVKAVAELGDKRMVLGNHFTHCYVGFSGHIKNQEPLPDRLSSTGLTIRSTSSGR